MTKQDRFWVELEHPRDKKLHGTEGDEFAERQCFAANVLIRTLYPSEPPGRIEFWWNSDERKYYFGGPMGFWELNDNGHWLNLSSVVAIHAAA